MAIATVLSGPFTSSYDSNSLGITEDGIRLAGSISKQTVTGDAHGDSIFDGVYRGGNWTVVLTSIEAIAARAAVEAYASLGVQGQVGRLDVGSSLAKSLVLNAVAGTPAATVVGSISTLTAPQSIVSENQQTSLELAARIQKIPLDIRLNLYDNAGTPTWFTKTLVS